MIGFVGLENAVIGILPAAEVIDHIALGIARKHVLGRVDAASIVFVGSNPRTNAAPAPKWLAALGRIGNLVDDAIADNAVGLAVGDYLIEAVGKFRIVGLVRVIALGCGNCRAS
jgi:hypothetical protein